MKHELNQCCGTTCDKRLNLRYVQQLQAQRDELITLAIDLWVHSPDAPGYKAAARRLHEIIREVAA